MDGNNPSVPLMMSELSSDVDGTKYGSDNPIQNSNDVQQSTMDGNTDENNNSSKCAEAHKVIAVMCLAIVLMLMIAIWAKFIKPAKKAMTCLYATLISCVSLGIAGVVTLIFSIFCCNGGLIRTEKPSSLYESIKIGAAFLFGLCNIAHGVIFIIKHQNGSNGCTHAIEGEIYNYLSIIYTILLIYKICFVKVLNESCVHRYCSVGILIANWCILFDTIFSEADSIFNHRDDKETTTVNHTSITLLCNYTKDSIDLIESFDPVLSVCSVEFAIITVDLFFSTFNQGKSDTDLKEIDGNNTAKPNVNTTQNGNSYVHISNFFFFLFIILSYTLVMTSISGFAISSCNVESEFLTLSICFKVYIVTSLIIKIAMLICVVLCIILLRNSQKLTLSVESLILSISFLGNLGYHVFYLLAVDQYSVDENEEHYIGCAYADNVISIIVAGGQTFLIGYIENGKNMSKRKHKNIVHYFCLLLFITNLGLWMSDSFGESHVPALSVIVERTHGEVVGKIFTKLILPFTTFFRIHSGLVLFRMYCHRDSHRCEQIIEVSENSNHNSQPSPI